MKKIILFIISAALLACSNSEEPDPKPRIYLSPSSTNLSIREQVNLDIKIENNEKTFFGISMQLNFDNSSLGFVDSTGFTAGDMFDQGALKFVQSNGAVVHLSLSQLSAQSSVGGSGKIGTLTFKAASAGNSDITITKDELIFYNSTGDKITISELQIGSADISVQ